jgi:hypothetical protein
LLSFFSFFLQALTLINVLFVILCRHPFIGFDGAKVRQFWQLTKHSAVIVHANSLFVDAGQIIATYSYFYVFQQKYAAISTLFRTFALQSACIILIRYKDDGTQVFGRTLPASLGEGR